MIQHGEDKEVVQPVEIVKCPCGHPNCNTYGLSDGLFYSGCGWSKERAQQYADAVNVADDVRQWSRPCGRCGQAYMHHWSDNAGQRYCSSETDLIFVETVD